MRIAVDAMGGDHAPDRPVAGVLAALGEPAPDFEIVLVGDESRLNPLLSRHSSDRLSVLHAPEAIGMDESPASALRRKKSSSIAVGMDLQKRGLADAFVSAGNTGAVMAAALTTLGRIEGLSRPAIMVVFPTQADPCLVLDAGANSECKPQHLAQFALMGHVYAAEILGRARPRIGLLSIGEEAGKGNDLTVAAHGLLSESGLNFVGNVEGRDVLRGAVDVVVTDGFSGNIALKTAEGTARFVTDLLRRAFTSSFRSKAGFALSRPALNLLKTHLDPNNHNGAVFLGLNGLVVKSHGGANYKGVANAIAVAASMVRNDITRKIGEDLDNFRAHAFSDEAAE